MSPADRNRGGALTIPSRLQECKALNGRLINFLKERSSVEKLLQYLVQAPPSEEAATEPKQQFKYSFAACEVRTRDQCAGAQAPLDFARRACGALRRV